MDIKMPVKFHGSYVVTIHSGDKTAKERCQKLTVSELSGKHIAKSSEDHNENDIPTHQITFYDFGCKRIVEGKLIENEEDRLVFQVEEKRYEFSPFRPSR
jgi:hypothetical protein